MTLINDHVPREEGINKNYFVNRMYLSTLIRAFPREVTKLLSVQVVRLSGRVFTQYLSFSYISAKCEAAVRFYKGTGAQQRRQVDEK